MGLTSLSTQSLLEGEPKLEVTPQFFPTIGGEEVKGYSAFAFRKDDAALLQAFNAELARLIGTEEHRRASRHARPIELAAAPTDVNSERDLRRTARRPSGSSPNRVAD